MKTKQASFKRINAIKAQIQQLQAQLSNPKPMTLNKAMKLIIEADQRIQTNKQNTLCLKKQYILDKASIDKLTLFVASEKSIRFEQAVKLVEDELDKYELDQAVKTFVHSSQIVFDTFYAMLFEPLSRSQETLFKVHARSAKRALKAIQEFDVPLPQFDFLKLADAPQEQHPSLISLLESVMAHLNQLALKAPLLPVEESRRAWCILQKSFFQQ